MATFRQRAGGWQARIRRQGFPDITKTFLTRQDAEKWARAVEREQDTGAYIHRGEAEKTTLADLLTRYGKEVSPSHKGYREEMWKIGVILRDKIASYSLVALTPKIIADYRDRRLKEVSTGTVRHEINLISVAFNTASREWGISALNPVTMIKKPVNGKARSRRISPDEVDAIIQHSYTKELPDFLRLALATGMRRGELLSLRWQDINQGRRIAILYDTKNGEDRIVPLSSKALSVLAAMPRRLDGRLFGLIKTSFSKALRTSVRRARKAYVAACIERGELPDPNYLVDIHLHDARHEAVSSFFELGLNMVEVASISGHKTLAMLKRYTHLRAEDLAEKLA